MGGKNKTLGNLSSVWKYDFELQEWNKEENCCFGIDSHATVLIEKKIITFGGFVTSKHFVGYSNMIITYNEG